MSRILRKLPPQWSWYCYRRSFFKQTNWLPSLRVEKTVSQLFLQIDCLLLTLQVPTQTDNVVQFFDALTSSSSKSLTWMVSISSIVSTTPSDTCHLTVTSPVWARTSQEQFPWFSPAGAQRGSILNTVKLHITQVKFREILTPEELTQLSSPGGGFLLWWQDCSFVRFCIRQNQRPPSVPYPGTNHWRRQNSTVWVQRWHHKTKLATLKEPISVMSYRREVSPTSLLSVMTPITLLTLLMLMNLRSTSSSNLHVLSTSSVRLCCYQNVAFEEVVGRVWSQNKTLTEFSQMRHSI